MMLRVIILSGSESVGHSLCEVLSKFLRDTIIEAYDNVTETTFVSFDVVILDMARPCNILGKSYTSDAGDFLSFIYRMNAYQNDELGTIPCLHFDSPDAPQEKRLLISPLLRELALIVTKKQLGKEHRMPSSGTAPAWHDLKNGQRIDYCLALLESTGFKYKADEYRRIRDEDPELAKEYANKEYDKARLQGSSRVNAHRSLSASTVSSPPSRRIEIGILLVDDQDYWFHNLKEQIDEFNATSDLYTFTDIRFCNSPNNVMHAVLAPGLHTVVLDFALGHANGKLETSIQLSKAIRECRPDLSIYGLTGILPPDSDSDTSDWAVDRVFYKSDAAEIHELLLAIIETIREKANTPYFSALRACARRPTAVFHAMPLSRAKSVAGSQWTREFAEFYGEGYFAGETSSTMPPLDSLFHPRRSLRDAMTRAKKAFLSDRTLFVTNGTTGGNSLVYGIHVKPGDLILLDRNCHRSHHYSAMQCGAQVAYIEPEHIDAYGVSSLVPLERILTTVKKYQETAKMLVLTHPTFDGVLYSPYEIIKQVMEIKKDIVFLFDEAWFAYGVFHRKFREYSAMAASLKLRCEGIEPRVYVTQSIHKTLSAIRQGSMIHIREPYFTEEIESAIEEAINSHVSTSPNAHVLGSLDVARMQAEIEGFDLLSQALEIAEWIREQFKDRNKPIYALNHDDLIGPLLQKESRSYLDPLKITLVVKGLPAAKFKKEEMYEKMGIQINKYSQNTILALVTIGTTWSMADHLVRSLRKWQSIIGQKNISVLKIGSIPQFSGFNKRYWGIDESVGKISHAASESHIGGKTTNVKYDTCTGKTSAVFVMPYPPGYPILVPGQTIDSATINYIRSLLEAGVEIGDIHGLDETECLRVFCD